MAESRIIKRNVRFWGKSGLQLTGMMLIFMVVGPMSRFSTS